MEALLAAQEKDRLEALLEQSKVNYELNPADVINEEDLEESAGDQTMRQLSQFSQTVKKVESKKKLEMLEASKAGYRDSDEKK